MAAVDPNYSINYVNGTLTVNKAGVTTVLGSAPDPSVFAQAVTFTATVSPQFSGTPTGTVSFVDNTTGATLGPAPTTAGVAKLTVSTLSVGNHSVTATYNGDSNFNSSLSSARIQTVNRAPTTLTAHGVTSPSLLHYTFSATLTRTFDGAKLGGENIAFSYNGHTICAGTTNSSGVASCTVEGLIIVIGKADYTASFAGDTDYLPSTGTAAI